YDTSKVETSTTWSKRNGWAIPVSYNVGNHGIYVTYARVGDTKTNAGTTADSSAKQWVLGYDYSLSKRTSVGVNYTKLNNDAGAVYNVANNKGTNVGVAGSDVSQFYAGIRHAY
ncbi:MAG TPA: porin, partial [Rhodocyclaceae bacterium]|nr:porin [Rhodocyclaceae bacterium]